LPHLQKLYEKYRGQGFAMVAFNMVAGQNSMIPEWKAKGKYTFPVVATEDEKYFDANPYGVRSTPTNVLLDGEGRAVFRHLGGTRVIEAEIRELLGLDPFPADAPAPRQSAAKEH
jgi:hypothetical protein